MNKNWKKSRKFCSFSRVSQVAQRYFPNNIPKIQFYVAFSIYNVSYMYVYMYMLRRSVLDKTHCANVRITQCLYHNTPAAYA